MTPPIVWKHLCNATRSGQEECIIRLGRLNVPVRVDVYDPHPIVAWRPSPLQASNAMNEPIYTLLVPEGDYYRALSTLRKEGLL